MKTWPGRSLGIVFLLAPGLHAQHPAQTGVMPGAQTFDLSLYKNWKLTGLGEAGRLQFRAELFNTLNTPQFGQPNGIGWATQDSVIPDALRMGEIRSLRQSMRIIQFGLKVYF